MNESLDPHLDDLGVFFRTKNIYVRDLYKHTVNESYLKNNTDGSLYPALFFLEVQKKERNERTKEREKKMIKQA